MKLCRDCKWRISGYFTGHRCRHPKAYRPETQDPVTGKTESDTFHLCGTMRMFSSDCGPEGNFWEQK